MCTYAVNVYSVDGIIWNTIAEFEFDILSDEDDNTLDYSCIQAMRYMTSCYIRTHAHQTNADVLKVEGKDVVSPTLADILINSKYYYGCDAHFVNDPVSTSFDDSINSYDVRISEPVSLMSSIDDYCKMHIERMHVEAPDAVIELGLIPLALNCACSLQRVVILQSTVAYHHEKKSKKSKKKEYELRGVTSVIQQVCNGVRNENVEHMENDAKMVTHDYFLAEAEENRHQSSSNDLKPTARCSTSSMNNINVNAFEVKDMMSDRLVEWKPPQDTTNDVYGFLHIYQYEYWLLTTSSNTKEVRRQKVMEIADGIAQLTHLKEETYVHPNAPQGLHNYKLAADRGHTDAQYQLALCYDMGLEGVHESKLNALKYYKLAADSGHTDSQYQLGLIYDLGVEGIAENRLMAIRYYKLAADKGHVDAIHMLLSYGVNIHRSGNTSSKTARQRRCCMRKLYGIMYPLGYFDGGAHKHIHPKAELKTYDSTNGSKGATKTPFSSPVRSDSVGIAQPRESSTAFQGTKEDAARIRHALQESPSTPVFLSPNAKVNVSASTNNNGCPPLNPMRSPGVMESSALKSQSVLTVEVPLTPNNPNVSAGDTGNPNNTWGYSPGRSEMESSGKTPLRLRRTVQSVIRDMKAKKLNHTETFVNTNAASAQFTPTLNLKPGGGGTSKPSKLLGEISSNYLKFSTSTITTALTTGTAATTDNENMSGKSNPPNEVMNDLLETPRMRHDLEGMSNDTETKSPEYQAKKPSPMMRQATWKRSRVEDLEGSDGDEFDDSNGTETSEESESDSDGSIFSDEIEEPDESVISEWMVSEQGDHIPRHRYIKFFIHNYKILAAFCRHIANSRIFQYFIFINIVLAGLIVGIQSYPAFAAYNWKFEIINKVILAAFTLEVVVKIVGEEFKPWHYFIDRHFVLNKWNIFDFLIVVLSVMFISVDGSGSRLQFLRVVRVLRFTKLFKRIPQLNMIVRGLTDSISFLSYITLLWAMVIFLYAVFGLLIFSDNDPWHFRSIEYAVFTLFQMTVLDVSEMILAYIPMVHARV